MLYKSHQDISIHSGNRHIKRPAWRILSHNWFVPRAPFFYINREIEQCPRLREQWEDSLSAISFSLLFSSLILSSSSFPSARGFSRSRLSFFLSFYFTRSIPSFVLTCSRLCTEHLLGLVFFSSNLARVNADGRFELFQFSERWDSEQEQSGGISGSNIREIRSLSGICSDIIRACCLTNYGCGFLSFNYGGMERNLRQGKYMNWQSF